MVGDSSRLITLTVCDWGISQVIPVVQSVKMFQSFRGRGRRYDSDVTLIKVRFWVAASVTGKTRARQSKTQFESFRDWGKWHGSERCFVTKFGSFKGKTHVYICNKGRVSSWPVTLVSIVPSVKHVWILKCRVISWPVTLVSIVPSVKYVWILKGRVISWPVTLVSIVPNVKHVWILKCRVSSWPGAVES